MTRPNPHSFRPALRFPATAVLVLAFFAATPAVEAQVTALYMFDYPGYVRCDEPSTYTYDVELHGTAATNNISLDLGYDANLSFTLASGTIGDATSCTTSANTITCSFLPTSAGAWTLTQSFDFTITDCSTPYSGVLIGDAIATWGSSGSITAREKGWAGPNCMLDMVGTYYQCTAGDVQIHQLFVDREDVIDGCISPNDDFVTGELLASLVTNATERYDIGVWIATDGGGGDTGECAAENLFDETIGLFSYGDTSTPYLDPEGDGPYRNIDNSPTGDDCGDTRDNRYDPLVYRNFGVRSLNCSDTDNDGFADVGYCTSWNQNANQGMCYFLEDALPATASKCACNRSTFGGVTVPNLTCTLDCGPENPTVSPGDVIGCELAFSNADGAGKADYVRYKLEDGAWSGTFSNFSSNAQRATTLTTTSSFDTFTTVASDEIVWTPDYRVADTTPWEYPGEHEGGVTRTITFSYQVPANFDSGSITIAANTYWYKTNSLTTPAWDGEVPQSLSCTFDMNFGPTWVHVSNFEAYADAGHVVVSWDTASEAASLGFNLYRRIESGAWTKVNDELLLAISKAPGGTYRFVDRDAPVGSPMEYRLVEVEVGGRELKYGPYPLTATRGVRASDPLMQADFVASERAPSEVTARRFARARELADTFESLAKGRKAGDAAKIEIDSDGLYTIDATTIGQALGLSLKQAQKAIADGDLNLTNEGSPVAWEAAPDGAGIRFYGRGIDSNYTDRNVYWLRPGVGTVMESVSGTGGHGSSAAAFTALRHIEQDLRPSAWGTFDPDYDYWFWFAVVSGRASGGSGTITFDAPGLSSSAGPAAVALNLWGLDYGDPNGSAEVHLNGTLIGSVSWDGAGPRTHRIECDATLLDPAVNNLEIVGSEGIFWVDSVDLSYPREYRAVSDRLLVPGGSVGVSIVGFSTADIAVYEIVDDAGTVHRLDGVLIENEPGTGAFSVSFAPPTAAASYLAVAHGGQLSPRSVIGDKPSDLASSNTRAEYVVIASDAFEGAAEIYAALQTKRGYRTKVALLDDIMDEFNDGVYSPEAIRSFLAYAHDNWRTAPSYVALIGKGSFDYKDHLGAGGNVMPAIMRPTSDGLIAADNAFADFTGNDGIPEMAIGRIPVLTPDELVEYTEKLEAYENEAGAGWTNRILMIADNADSSGDFPADSDALGKAVPHSVYDRKIYLGAPYSAGEAHSQIVDGLNTGATLVSYVGHGALDHLAHEDLFGSTDLGALHNDSRLHVMTAFTCYVNFHAYPGFTSLGEEMVIRPTGGAAAVWSSSSLSMNPRSALLGEFFFNSLYTSAPRPIGDTILDAMGRFKRQGGDKDTCVMYNVLGDPAFIMLGPDSK